MLGPFDRKEVYRMRLWKTAGKGAAEFGYLITWPGFQMYRLFRVLERIGAGGIFAAVALFYFLGIGFYELYLDDVNFLIILAKNMFGFCLIGGFGSILINAILSVIVKILYPIYQAHMSIHRFMEKPSFRIRNGSPYFVCRIK